MHMNAWDKMINLHNKKKTISDYTITIFVCNARSLWKDVNDVVSHDR